MGGDEWNCPKCTFLHHFPGQRCTMCNALRVTKEEMRDFVRGGKKMSEQRDDENDNNAHSSGSGNQKQRLPLHHQGAAVAQSNDGSDGRNNNVAAQRFQGTSTTTSNPYQRTTVAVNPYAKKSQTAATAMPSTSNNNTAVTRGTINNSTRQQNSMQNNAMSRPENNAFANRHTSTRPIINPYSRNNNNSSNADASNRGGTAMMMMNGAGLQHNPAAASNFGHGQGNRNNSLSPQQHHQQQQQQQQRSTVTNPYSKSTAAAAPPPAAAAATATSRIVSHVPTQQRHHNSFASSSETADAVATSHAPPPNHTSNSERNQPQQNQNLHRFFTGGRGGGGGLHSTQRPQPSHATTTTTNPTASTDTRKQQQRFSLSAKKQLPYIEGPVPLCTSTSHNWIYPMDEKYPERAYQLEMSQSAIFSNTLVSLPTGLGKTLIAAVVMYNYYRWFPTGKIVFCAPTRPLVSQQIEACYKIMGIPERHTAEITGRLQNTSRKAFWDNKRVFFCTPQTLMKDIEEDRCDPTQIVCLVLDEAHKATGRHSCALLSQMIQDAGGKFRLLALSATPGTDIKSIQAVIETLKISRIEARTEDDPNVKRYIHNRQEEVISVKQPDVIKILDKKLLEFVKQPLERLRSVNAANRLMGDSANLGTYAVMKAQEEYIHRTGDHRMYHTFQALRCLVDVRIGLKNHGIQYALQNIARKEMEAKGPLRSIFHSEEFRALKQEMQVAAGDPTECLSQNNPKYEKLTEVLLEHFERKKAIGESTRVIVFSQLRESVMGIVSMLSLKNSSLIKPTPFIGQSKKKESERNPGQEGAGMNQAQQQRILQQFNDGHFNVLVCTCVGEEGLDIGDVDLIVNFDILKSAIRSIQRVGRTGRKRNGRVIFLVSEGQEERSYRDSVTNSKKIARALRDPSVFKLCQNSPMFPDEPSLMRQKMVVNDFHMSQIGGHTPKTRRRGKTTGSKKRNGERIAAVDNSWMLAQSQQHERTRIFGSLPYSSCTEYETENVRGNFPSSLRKTYLKARRGLSHDKSVCRGRTTAILSSLEKLYLRPSTTRVTADMDNKRSTPIDEVSMCDSSDGGAAFDVDSDDGFAEDLHRGASDICCEGSNDDGHQIGCNEVSPDINNKDSLGEIFGHSVLNESSCLSSQQMTYLFDSEDHHDCSVVAPPPYGDLQDDSCSDSSDEDSSTSHISIEQSQLSANSMNDDDLCAFFERPNDQRQLSNIETQHLSLDDSNDFDGINDEFKDGDKYNDNADFHMSQNNDDENATNEEKESIHTSQNDPDPSAVNAGVCNAENAQHYPQHDIMVDHTREDFDHDCPTDMTLGKHNPDSIEVGLQTCDIRVERFGHYDDGSMREKLSPPPSSPVTAFQLPTPPTSSDEDSDNENEVDEELNEHNNILSSVNEHQDPLLDDASSQHLDTSATHAILNNFEPLTENAEDQPIAAGEDVQENNCHSEINPLQLPTQYSSSSDDEADDDDDDDDDDVSVGGDVLELDAEGDADVEMQSTTINVAEEVVAKHQHEQKYAIGTKISKEFKDPSNGQTRMYQGEIRAFYSQDNQDKLYNVVFEDGDCEDMEENEITMHLALDEKNSQLCEEDGQQQRSQMSSEDKLTDSPTKAVVKSTTGAISRMSLDSLADTPVVKRKPERSTRMSLDSLADTPVVKRVPERSTRMSLDSLTDTPIVKQMPERKRLRPNDATKEVSTRTEPVVSKQDRLKRRIEEKYRCRFLDTEAANDDSDSGDEDEEGDEMSHDSFINDTSQLGYSQDDLDRLNESVEECHDEHSDTIHRQLDHEQSVRNQFKTPILNRRMQLPRSQQSQSSCPPSQRGLGNMNFIKSVIDHHRKGGDCDEIEEAYNRLEVESSQEILTASQNEMDVYYSERKEEQVQPRHSMAANVNSNNSTRDGLGSNHASDNSAAPNVSKENASVNTTKQLTAAQKAMIEAKRIAALKLRQEKMNQQQQQQQQVPSNPYAK